jgi:hypothetical protein
MGARLLRGVCRLLGAGAALYVVAYAPVTSAATIDIHATALTGDFTSNGAGGGTLVIHSTSLGGYTTQVNAAPAVSGPGTFDLNITFTTPSTATLNTAVSGFGFKLTAPSATVTAAIGATGSWMSAGGITMISIANYILNGVPSSSGLTIEIDSFSPGSATNHSIGNLQSDVTATAADVPLPNTAGSLIVLLSATGLWAIRRRRQLI